MYSVDGWRWTRLCPQVLLLSRSPWNLVENIICSFDHHHSTVLDSCINKKGASFWGKGTNLYERESTKKCNATTEEIILRDVYSFTTFHRITYNRGGQAKTKDITRKGLQILQWIPSVNWFRCNIFARGCAEQITSKRCRQLSVPASALLCPHIL